MSKGEKIKFALWSLATVFVLCTGYARVTEAACNDSQNPPCGAVELITCAAQSMGISAEDFFNTKLFSSSTLDGFCKSNPSGMTVQQQYFYTNYCKNPGTYYSWDNFSKAMSAAIFQDFACASGTRATMRYKELINFLATIASETTFGVDHSNDGLYYRYEHGALVGTTLDSHTQYYPVNDFKVTNPQQAYSCPPNDSSVFTFTAKYWQSNGDPQSAPYTMTYNLDKSPLYITFEQIPASGLTPLNQIICPMYWIGMGPTQLTGYAMMSFFGWYQQNMASGYPVQSADFKGFIENYLNDGGLGFTGALWYWVDNVPGYNIAPIHQIFSGANANKDVCHDIATATYAINGGCNDYDQNRLLYYKYFMEDAFNMTVQSVTGNYCVYASPSDTTGACKALDSLKCCALYDDQGKCQDVTPGQNLYNYCTQAGSATCSTDGDCKRS